jgi:hypothetical protein
MPSLVVHLMNEDPVVGEVDALPTPSDYTILLRNPRRRDGKDLSYLDTNVTNVIFPIHRISFIEVVTLGEEEEIITQVRER